jgi:hypothetical protein
LDATFLRNAGAICGLDRCAPMREQGSVRLHLSSNAAKNLANGLAVALEKKLLLLIPTTAGWDRCAAQLTWEVGSREPVAITAALSDSQSMLSAKGESLLGCFITFIAPTDEHQGAQMIEDGFSVFMTDQVAQQLIQALRSDAPIRIGAIGMPLAFDVVVQS